MKLQSGIVILAIITIISLLIGPAAATLISTATIVIVGNDEDHITLTPPQNIANWNLNYGSNNVGATLTVNSNNYWGVNVRSDQNDGKMKEFYNSAYISSGDSLHNPLHVLCTSPVAAEVSLTDQNQPLVPSGQTNIQGDTTCSITFNQNVDNVLDTRADPPHRYHIQVIFTGYISY